MKPLLIKLLRPNLSAAGSRSPALRRGMFTRHFPAWGGGVLLLIGMVGCGSCVSQVPRVAVSGEVALDGNPVSNAVIAFYPTGTAAGPAAVSVVENGKFNIPLKQGPPAGELRVEIRGVPPEDGEPAKPGDLATPPAPDSVPDRYRGENSSLKVTTSRSESNNFQFELVSDLFGRPAATGSN